MYTIENESLSVIADGIRKKTGKTNLLRFPAGFVSAIESIETGGSTTPVKINEKDVNFFDYDGTLIASYTVEEAKTLSTLPEPPKHAGLVFQQWNWTLDDVHTITEFADIGALYTTDDGATRLKIEVIDAARGDISLNFSQSVGAGTVIDWGDGGEPEASGDALICQMQHTYANAGTYIISMKPADNCTLRLGQSVSSPIIGGVTTYNRVSPVLLLEAYIGDRVTTLEAGAFSNHLSLKIVSMSMAVTGIYTSVFRGCQSLSHINWPSTLSTVMGSAFYNCSAIRHISTPSSMVSIRENALYGCSSLQSIVINTDGTCLGLLYECATLQRVSITCQKQKKFGDSMFYKSGITKITIPDHITELEAQAFDTCQRLSTVTVEGSISQVLANLFRNCYCLKTVDLSHCTAVPELSNVSAFNNTPKDLEILVPAALADEWKQATNWTTLANKIKGV